MSQSNSWNRFFYNLNGVLQEAIIEGNEIQAEHIIETWNKQGFNGRYNYEFIRMARTVPVTKQELADGIEMRCHRSNVNRLLCYK